jgi:hypothetical protein
MVIARGGGEGRRGENRRRSTEYTVQSVISIYCRYDVLLCGEGRTGNPSGLVLVIHNSVLLIN